MNIDKQTLYWLAGLLEGEGSFCPGPPSAPNRPRITLAMTDEDIIARVAWIFDVKYFVDRSKNGANKTPYVVSIRGRRAVKLMKDLYPLMESVVRTD
jgi:hypothetical protein